MNCKRLKSVYIPSSVTSIGHECFYNYLTFDSIRKIYCERTSQPSDWEGFCGDGFNVTYWGVLKENLIEDDQGIFYIVSEGNAMVTSYAGNSSSVTIPSTINGYPVTAIGTSAFQYDYIYKILFSENSQLASINNFAFSSCGNLESVDIPSSVESIGVSAFYNCSRLQVVEFGDNSQLTSIGSNSFSGCNTLYIIVIPINVTSIGSFTFFEDGNSLTIYCEATSKPSGWDSYWNYGNRPVYWYSETQPTTDGNYWHYVGGVVTKW